MQLHSAFHGDRRWPRLLLAYPGSPVGFCRRAVESLSPTVEMMLLYHMRDKDDTKNLVESAFFLWLRRAVSFSTTGVGHTTRKKITRENVLPQAFHFLLNFLCTVVWEVLNSSGSFILWPSKVCRQLREEDILNCSFSCDKPEGAKGLSVHYWYTNRPMTERVQQKFHWDNSHNVH